MAFASTAPVAPATALPHGERRCGFDWPAMRAKQADCLLLSVYRRVSSIRGAVASRFPRKMPRSQKKKEKRGLMKRVDHDDTKKNLLEIESKDRED